MPNLNNIHEYLHCSQYSLVQYSHISDIKFMEFFMLLRATNFNPFEQWWRVSSYHTLWYAFNSMKYSKTCNHGKFNSQGLFSSNLGMRKKRKIHQFWQVLCINVHLIKMMHIMHALSVCNFLINFMNFFMLLSAK